MKVKYVERVPKINILPLAVNRDARQVLDLFCTKSKAWAYEQEWRCIHKVAGTLFCYPPEVPKGVYFGSAMSRESIEIICLILEGQNPDVELWLGKRSRGEFKMEFSPTSYTPHIDAKRLGLVQ